MSEENQLFWKAYASTVKNIMVSGPVGDNTAGISGGKDIPAVCTNWGIYQYADFLLDPTNPNFVASKVSRYSEALNMTLQTLTPDAGGDNSPDAWDRLNKAKERLAIFRSELDDAKKQAMQDLKDDDNPDKPNSFAQWAPLNANAYLVAFQNWEAATNEVQMKTNAIGGAGSALLAEAQKSAANGSNTLTEVKGYNMKASIQSVTNIDVKSLMAKLGDKPPAMFQKVRPTQILIAQGVSMEISFSGHAKTAFDQDYKKTVQGGGGIGVFGFRIGASSSSSEGNGPHDNTWNSSSGVLTINAENSRASANVLVVMGEIVSA
ncbi:hypothetical protein FAGAP_3714 [Fusarium agapanthi]|uniref:Uncharacterized protein n=1 Tax=Fusarium agapanthi TaxID=1803897 RepID=A0A9P5EG71_9HYPO|nr:hypothetical protein FAGAP_3714 [Fusarium agapanthi]